MSLTDITKKILDDARSDAKQIRKGADAEVRVIKEETKRLGGALEKKQAAQIAQAGDRAGQERIVLYRQKIKARLDKEKRALLEGVFEKALKSMREEDKMQALLESRVEHLDVRGEDALVDVPKGKEAVVRKILGDKVKGAKYIETDAVTSGCRIRTDSAEYDFTIESMIRDSKQTLEAEVARILFGRT